MKRGDIVLAAAGGDYGKPRPWVVIQSNAVRQDYASITLCPVTTTITPSDFRVRVAASVASGLRDTSDIMVDKVQTLPRERIRAELGSLDAETMKALDNALRVWLGLA